MWPRAPGISYRWLLVALAFIEVLTGTGIMFGWSAISLALTRDGVYSELCSNSTTTLVNQTVPTNAGVCDAQALRLNVVYGVAASSFPLSMFFWGPAIDRWGARGVRIGSLAFFISGSLLFALTHADGEVVVENATDAMLRQVSRSTKEQIGRMGACSTICSVLHSWMDEPVRNLTG